MATYVLVHGSWHGGWCWRHVSPLLRAAGHESYAPTLTGLGDRSHQRSPEVGLNTHVTDVGNLLFYEDLTEVVLVGHSYAGLVIKGVAETVPERLARLIYLDAYVPAAGQSWFSMHPEETVDSVRAEMENGRGYRPPKSPDFFGVTEPKMASWVEERLVPQPRATYEEPVPSHKSSKLPCSFVHFTEGPLAPRFAPFAVEAREEGWKVRELQAGHDAMLTAPRELASLLIELGGT